MRFLKMIGSLGLVVAAAAAFDLDAAGAASVPTADTSPVGALDPIVGRTVRGWALDPDYAGMGHFVDVELYLDGPLGVGNKLTTIPADKLSEPEVGGNGSVRFEHTLPSSVDDRIHYVYAYARGRYSDGSPADLVMLPGSPRQLGRAAPDRPSIRVTYRDGSTFDAAQAIHRYALRRTEEGSLRVHALADNFFWSMPDWFEAEYTNQADLIARKQLSFGDKDTEFRRVRGWLFAAPLDADGVFAIEGGKMALSEMKVSDANAEYIMMARDYLAFTGERATLQNTADHFLCTHDAATGAWRVATPPGTYSDDRCNIVAALWTEASFDQFLYGPWERSPGVILGQYFTSTGPVDQIKLGLRRRHACAPPLAIYVNSGKSTVAVLSVDARSTPLVDAEEYQGLTIPLYKVLPAGTYYVEVHPQPWPTWPNDSGDPMTKCLSDERVTEKPPSQYAYIWRSDGAPRVSGGATNKTFRNDAEAFGPVEPVNVRFKLDRAMSAQLARAQRPTGAKGIYIIDDARYRGTAEQGVAASNYYDIIKAGFKDAYTNLRFLESLDAWADLAEAQIVAPLDGNVRGQVEADFVNHFVQPGGRLESWVGCSKVGTDGRSHCSPDATGDAWHHPYDLGMMPSQALAARLVHIDPRPADANASMRDCARDQPGLFRTNLVAVEDVEVRLWEQQEKWLFLTPSGRAEHTSYQTDDWHIFDAPYNGYGNYRYQEENGGYLLSTTAFMLQAGPYPKMLSDWQGLSTRLDEIFNHLERWRANGGHLPVSMLAHAPEYLRKRVTDPTVYTLCRGKRTPENGEIPLDIFGEEECKYYKSVSYHLPEAGEYLYALVEGLLRLEVRPTGAVLVYGQPLTVGSERTLDLAALGVGGIPPELTTLEITKLNVQGRPMNLTCNWPDALHARCTLNPG